MQLSCLQDSSELNMLWKKSLNIIDWAIYGSIILFEFSSKFAAKSK